MRHLAILAAVGAAFLCGSRLARGDNDGLVRNLEKRQRFLFKDLRKIEQAVKDIVELREMRASGKYVLNHEEKKLEKKSRMDFHIFMERYRNDTLETLEIYDRVLNKQDYVDPLRRVFGKTLDEIVAVDWDEEDIETILAEIQEGYGIQLNVSGELDYRTTISLKGEMSLLAILLYLESTADAKLIERKGALWFVKVKRKSMKKDGAEDE